MEDIYTIKVRTDPDPRSLYPSERRYSASTVLGLGVVHLALATTTLLLAALTLTAHGPQINTSLDVLGISRVNNSHSGLNVTESEIETRDDDVAFLDDEEEETTNKDDAVKEIKTKTYGNQFASLTLAPCLMSLGALTAGVTGLLAWKRWYIDHNIRWFFCMSTISTITSLACLIITGLTVGMVTEQRTSELTASNTFIFSFSQNNLIVDRLQQSEGQDSNDSIQSKMFSKSTDSKSPNLRLVLAINILIASVLEFAWSVMSSKMAFYGMRNNYPDDIILSRGKVEVNTVHKGNKKKKKMVAPDILNHHPKKRKFVKYFPKKENDFLPKQESNVEYQDRVNKFLSSNVCETSE